MLTVRAHQPNSRKSRGWETFADAIIRQVNAKDIPVFFVLWDGYAQKKIPPVAGSHHTIVQAAHPSPLSARARFR